MHSKSWGYIVGLCLLPRHEYSVAAVTHYSYGYCLFFMPIGIPRVSVIIFKFMLK